MHLGDDAEGDCEGRSGGASQIAALTAADTATTHPYSTALVSDLCSLCRCVICHSICTNVYSCTNGHVTCKSCLLNMATIAGSYEPIACAMCRDRCVWSRSLLPRAVLGVIESVLGPFLRCENDGCSLVLSVDDLERHRRNCRKRMVACPCSDCVTELVTDELVRHVASHDDIISIRSGVPVTFLVSHLDLDRVFVICDENENRTVIQMDCTGAFGRSGPHEIHQGMIRTCALSSAKTNHRVTVMNRSPHTRETVESTEAIVDTATNIRVCKARAHASVLAETSAAFDAQHVFGREISFWWESAKIRDIRKGFGAQMDENDSDTFLRRRHQIPVSLITYVFNLDTTVR